MAVTSCVRRKACTPSRASGARRGGAGHGCCPVGVGGGDPQDPLRVPAGPDDKEEQGGARALLPEDLPSVVGTPGPGEGGDRRRPAQPRGACVAGGRAGHQVGSLGNASHMTVYEEVGLVGRGRVGVSSVLSMNIVTSPTFQSSSGRCRRWSPVSSSDTPPGVCGPRLVQVRCRVHGAACPQGVQQGWGAAVEGRGRPFARLPQRVPHRQGAARPLERAPLHPVPVEGSLGAYEPPPDGVHDSVHRRE